LRATAPSLPTKSLWVSPVHVTKISGGSYFVTSNIATPREGL
jgi:hypothetical protein